MTRPTRFLSGLAALAFILTPAAASAQTGPDKLKAVEVNRARDALHVSLAKLKADVATHKSEIAKSIQDGSICTNLAGITALTIDDVQQASGLIVTENEVRALKISNERSATDARIASVRAAADSRLAEQLQLLQSSAGSTTEKTAAIAFSSALKSAGMTQRSAMDSAKQAYRAGVDTAIARHKQAISDAAEKMNFNIALAIVAAKNACDGGLQAKAAATQVGTLLKTAKSNFQSSFKANNESLQIGVRDLESTRRRAALNANDTYSATMQAARAALLKAFPNSTSIN